MTLLPLSDEEAQAHGLLHPTQELEMMAKMSESERMEFKVRNFAARIQFYMKRRGKCLACGLSKDVCICDELDKLMQHDTIEEQISEHRVPDATVKAPVNIRFIIWMHFKERYRASNTGKLLLKLFPGSKALTYGSSDDYNEFCRILEENKASRDTNRPVLTLLLFPSLDALDASSLAAEGQGQCHQIYKELTYYEQLDIVLLDGTWSQANRIYNKVVSSSAFGADKLLPVKISPTELSRFTCRRQSQKDRISTIEAAAMLLKELQVADGKMLPFPGGRVEKLHDALALLCNAFDKQSGRRRDTNEI